MISRNITEEWSAEDVINLSPFDVPLPFDILLWFYTFGPLVKNKKWDAGFENERK